VRTTNGNKNVQTEGMKRVQCSGLKLVRWPTTYHRYVGGVQRIRSIAVCMVVAGAADAVGVAAVRVARVHVAAVGGRHKHLIGELGVAAGAQFLLNASCRIS